MIVRLLKKYKRAFSNLWRIVQLEKKFGCYIEMSANVVYNHQRDIQIGKGVYVGAFTTLNVLNEKGKNNSSLRIGEQTYIGELNNIRAGGGQIIIGKKCLISQGVTIVAANHNTLAGIPIMDQPWSEVNAKVIIEDDVWIGAGSIILPGVHIGRGSVIAAGSVVTKSVESDTVVKGVPAVFHAKRI